MQSLKWFLCCQALVPWPVVSNCDHWQGPAFVLAIGSAWQLEGMPTKSAMDGLSHLHLCLSDSYSYTPNTLHSKWVLRSSSQLAYYCTDINIVDQLFVLNCCSSRSNINALWCLWF